MHLTKSNFEFQEGIPFELPSLPEPVPLPPEEGMVIYRGKWVKQSEKDRIDRKRANKVSDRPRAYNYTPFNGTITGLSKPETVIENELGEIGEYSCPICSAKFERARSLNVHMSRAHHPDPQVQCPECGKKLSHKTAMKKHLLSHRPEEEWPYQCPFPHCLKNFQAKGDLPKHWRTSKHKEDNIPPNGSPAFLELLDKCVKLRLGGNMTRRTFTNKNLVGRESAMQVIQEAGGSTHETEPVADTPATQAAPQQVITQVQPVYQNVLAAVPPPQIQQQPLAFSVVPGTGVPGTPVVFAPATNTVTFMTSTVDPNLGNFT